MSEYYYYRSPSGNSVGPYTVAQLKEMAARNRILPSTHIRAINGNWLWKAAGNMPELFPQYSSSRRVEHFATDDEVPASSESMSAHTALAKTTLDAIDALHVNIMVSLKPDGAITELVEFLHQKK